MVTHNGPSPKRRRTDEPPSAEEIAQANSTIQFFTGQRQNRWLQGYVEASGGNAPHSPSQPTRVPATVNGGVGSGQKQDATPKAGASSGDNAQHHPPPPRRQESSHQQSPDTAGAMSTNPVNQATGRVVQYESPCNPSAQAAQPSSTDTARKSLDRMTRSVAPPGLPSPVSSDGNTYSPTAPGTSTFAANMPPGKPSAPKRGRPPLSFKAPANNRPILVQNGSPVGRAHQRALSMNNHSHQALSQPNQRTVSNGTPQQSSQAVPSQPEVSQQQLGLAQLQSDAYLLAAMTNALDTAKANRFSQVPHHSVDSGRLTLLSEAIEKNDWFYITLSQVHALASIAPNSLPDNIRALGSKPFEKVDALICTNRALRLDLLQWLANFPMPISTSVAPTLQAHYAMQVPAVHKFLQLLGTRWDVLVDHCKQRQAPPLVEDLFNDLRLISPVLQTTAFRAIARMIWDSGKGVDPSPGVERLEALHTFDQRAFGLGLRRTTDQRAAAYNAYRKSLDSWRLHETRSIEARSKDTGQEASSSFHLTAEVIQPFQEALSQITSLSHRAIANNDANFSANLQGLPANMANGRRIAPAQNNHAHGRQQPHLPSQPAHSQAGLNRGVLMNMTMPVQQHHQNASYLLFPHEKDQPRAQPTQPDTIRSALHQAHLRSPTLGHSQPMPNQPRLYRYVAHFAMSPRKINKDLPVDWMQFDVSQEAMEKIPQTAPPRRPGEPPTRKLDEGSQTYRLRCVAMTSKGFPDEKTWVEADNVWPDNLFLELNGVMLEPRRKLHHGRYLPIDLTAYVKPGTNTLTVIVNRMSTDKRPWEYALAIEIVGVKKHETITSEIPTIDAAESLKAIKASLSAGNDDDDVAITSSNMTIQLFDPHTNAKIFSTPVRGSGCLHKDCFDLETFLGICKRERAGWPTVVDCWRCPICRGDVRPHTLLIDGFLVDVRQALKKMGKLDTRAIIVEQDGQWKAKVEELTGVRSASLEREESAAAKKAPPEVIEILDD